MSEDKPLFLFAFADYTGWLNSGTQKRGYDPNEYITLHSMCVFLDLWARRGGPADPELKKAVGTLSQTASHVFAKNTQYPKYLLSDHWKTVRDEVLEPIVAAGKNAKGKPKCPRCGKYSSLQVHHKTYANIGRERAHELEPLCAKCHEKEHGL